VVWVEGGSYDWVWGLKELIRADHLDLPVYEDEFAQGRLCSNENMVTWQVQIFKC